MRLVNRAQNTPDLIDARAQFECAQRADQIDFVGARRANRSTRYTICRNARRIKGSW